jgi:hypothetical protein
MLSGSGPQWCEVIEKWVKLWGSQLGCGLAEQDKGDWQQEQERRQG